jgi:VIT1/CCC1 family predicted Fe2+/Mn2+ transporter
MKKVAIKIKRYTNNVGIVNNNNLGKKILNVLLYALGTLACAYVLILGNMIFNTVARQSLSAQTKVLSNEVGDLEFKYLSLANGIDLTLSSQMGFRETKASFAVRKSLGTLSVISNEL